MPATRRTVRTVRAIPVVPVPVSVSVPVCERGSAVDVLGTRNVHARVLGEETVGFEEDADVLHGHTAMPKGLVSSDACQGDSDTHTGQSSGRGMCVVPTIVGNQVPQREQSGKGYAPTVR